MKDHWLRKRLKEVGKNNRGLAQHLRVADPRITEMIKGEREVQTDEIVPLAEFLEWSVDDLFGAMGRNPHKSKRPGLYVKGEAQAGHWKDAAHWQQVDWEPVSLPIPAAYREKEPFILRVIGDSMDEVYPNGTLIVCVAAMNLGREVKNGERVVVERQGADDQVEITVKEYHVDGSRKWLVAKSTKPEFSGAVELFKRGTESIQVVALIIAHFGTDAS